MRVVRRAGFSYEFDDRVVPREIGEEFAEGFEAMGFGEGQTVQVGWMILKVVAGPHGLELHEPDMKGTMPIQFVPGLTRTLLDTMRQRYVIDSVGLTSQMDFATLVQSVLTCTGLRPGAPLFLTRPDPPEDNVSGWICCCCEKGHDHNDPEQLELVSLYVLGCRHPEVVEFLALPVGTVVMFPPEERPRLWHEDEELSFLPDSYLAEKWPD